MGKPKKKASWVPEDSGFDVDRGSMPMTDGVDGVDPALAPDAAAAATRGDDRVQHTIQLIDGVKIPYMYEIWGDGVYRRTDPDRDPFDPLQNIKPDPTKPLPFQAKRFFEQVLPAPVWLDALAIDDDQNQVVKICYRPVRGKPSFTWKPRSTITSKRGLSDPEIVNKGLPFNDQNVKNAVNYLALCEQANRDQAPRMVANRVGLIEVKDTPDSKEVKYGWLLGSKWIGPKGIRIEQNPEAQGDFSKAFEVKGDYKEWLARCRELIRIGPIQRLTLGASFAAPLMRFLGQRTFIWYLYGESKFGKTALEKFALSAWGNPDELRISFNGTQIGLQEIFKHMTDLPLLVDERQAAGKGFDTKTYIYSLCDEKTRTRSSAKGGIQKKIPYRTLVLASGEESLVKDDLGGQSTRVLEISINKEPRAKEPGKIHEFVAKNYGHAGPKFLEEIVDLINDPDHGLRMLQTHFEEFKTLISERVPALGEEAKRIALCAYAYALVAWQILGEYEDFQEALEAMIPDAHYALDIIQKETVLDKGHTLLRSHRAESPESYITPDLEKTMRPNQLAIKGRMAIEFANEIWYIPTAVDRWLKSCSVDAKVFWSRVEATGVLQCSGNDLTLDRTWNNVKSPFYVVSREPWESGSFKRPTAATEEEYEDE